jgi:hypothetical protein
MEFGIQLFHIASECDDCFKTALKLLHDHVRRALLTDARYGITW